MKASIIKTEVFIFFLGVIFFNEYTFAQNFSCESLQPIEIAQTQKPTSTSSIVDWANYQKRVFEARKLVALNIFQSYISGSFDDRFFESCIKSKQEYEALEEILPSTFLDESLKILNLSQSRSVKNFSEIINSRIKNNNFILFRLAGHFKEDPAPTDLAGGFHRGQGSIFMNFTKIPPNEWLIIFVHELTHSLDVQLSNAISEYSKNEIVLKLTKDKKVFQQLSRDEKSELHRWLMSGLDRGFLAEYRAWTITFKIYQDGLDEGLWKPIDWMNSILNHKLASENLSDFTFRYLDPRFINPTEWPFRASPVKESLESIRAQMRRNDINKPGLFNLENILD